MWDRKKFTLSFILVTLVALLAYGGIVYMASMAAWDQIDRDVALNQWQILVRSLNGISTDLQGAAVDHANWDEMRALVSDSITDLDQISDELASRLSERDGAPLVLVTDTGGDIVYETDLDLMQIGELLDTRVAHSASLGKADNGLYVIAGVPFIIAASPVPTEQDAPPYGRVLLGRPIDDSLLEEVKALLGRDVMLFRDGELVASSRPLSKGERQQQQALLETSDQSRLTTQRSSDGGTFATNDLLNTEGLKIGHIQMEIPNFAGPTMRPAVTFASLAAILLGLAASYILAQAIGGRLAETADALEQRERENARLYAEVHQLNNRLESLISERTTQLRAAVSELQEVQTQLIQADRLAALGTLTASIVHELGTPLTTIMGTTHMLLDKEADKEDREWLEQIRDATLISQEIMTRVRTLARRQRVRREMLDLNHVIGDALDLLRYQLSLSEIDYSLDLHEKLPKIMADETQTQQILFNLINNARESLEQSPPPRDLIIRTEQVDDKVRLLVIDNGPGLDEDGTLRIFDPFYTTKPPSIGTGLGLYISKGIIESYGGQITGANREDGRGAVFTVEFPAGMTGLAGGKMQRTEEE